MAYKNSMFDGTDYADTVAANGDVWLALANSSTGSTIRVTYMKFAVIEKGGSSLTEFTAKAPFSIAVTQAVRPGYSPKYAIVKLGDLLSAAGYPAYASFGKASTPYASRPLDQVVVTDIKYTSQAGLNYGFHLSGGVSAGYNPVVGASTVRYDDPEHVRVSMACTLGAGSEQAVEIRFGGRDVPCDWSYANGTIEAVIALADVPDISVLTPGVRVQLGVRVIPIYNPEEIVPWQEVAATSATKSGYDIDGSVRRDGFDVIVELWSGDGDDGVAVVSLDDGTMDFDTAVTPVGETTAVLRLVCQPSHAVYTVAAFSADMSSYGTMSLTAPDCPPRLEVARADGSARVVGLYNMEVSGSASAESKTVKLSGRGRPCEYYGEGGTMEYSASWSIMPEDADAAKDVYRLCGGDCVAVMPWGERTRCAVSAPSVVRSSNSRLLSASCTIAEVAR